jgi:hypothetical protein
VEISDAGPEIYKSDIKADFDLATIKSIVKAMGGKLLVESTVEMTKFTVTVPCRTV